MIDTPTLIQERMEETKSQLSDKLESLDQHLHVSDTMQSTSSAVAATAEAVQVTAETVTGAMQSVSDAFDVRRQMEEHPWMVLGGAVAVGYFAHELLTGTEWTTSQPSEAVSKLGLNRGTNGHSRDHQDRPVNVTASAATTPAYKEAQMMSSPFMQLKTLAFNTILDMARDAAARAVPLMSDYVTASLERTRSHLADVSKTESSRGADANRNI